MKGLTPEERRLMLECEYGDGREPMTDREYTVFDQLQRRGLVWVEDNGEYLDSTGVTALGREVLEIDELSRSSAFVF